MRYALILAGGSGTRLWPLSRDAEPKQLIPLLEGRSLLEEAWARLDGLVPTERRLVCGAERHRAAVLGRLPALGQSSGSASFDRYIGEPVGRDTLAAITLSCALVLREDPEAVLAVFTSDHVIRPLAGFRALVERAFGLLEAEAGLLVTYGVRPLGPATGFGYLELGESIAESGLSPSDNPARRVLNFLEKPDAARAASFVAAGSARYLWNSGMFAWGAGRFVELARRYEPGLVAAIEGIVAAGRGSGFTEALAAGYPSLGKLSVDHGLMERASGDPEVRIAALPLDIEWLDIGSWPAYGGLLAPDGGGNVSAGTAVFAESRDNIAVSTVDGHLVACLGCEELIVVHTADATLVCPRSRADELKKLHGLVAGMDEGRWR